MLEEARVDWLFTEAAKHGVEKLTEGIVVAQLEIQYQRAIGFNLPVHVSMGVTKIGNASFTIDYIVTVAGATAATASTCSSPSIPRRSGRAGWTSGSAPSSPLSCPGPAA